MKIIFHAAFKMKFHVDTKQDDTKYDIEVCIRSFPIKVKHLLKHIIPIRCKIEYSLI